MHSITAGHIIYTTDFLRTVRGCLFFVLNDNSDV